ncbi:helix-turn-helix domain-containing protein [Roseivivax sp. GX 12232]|uniref:helix-turn-helix domain-containing protein n=1 Tax=Roseivivax sp. GX 12232 TaxID=2900547 RepID=UPI001E3F9EB9|nr:helix-turn-helix transcriptional regulator [Roseivivax sp. GX 12232]MCE0505222.1 helix-turn-helix domain-containing protein [Roseivivax sp. GX 12232]
MTTQDRSGIGSTFQDFLEEEGIAHEVRGIATKKLLAAMLEAEMQKRGLNRSSMAREMQTSRAQIQRLLDPENDSVTLTTLQRAARILGKELRIELV